MRSSITLCLAAMLACSSVCLAKDDDKKKAPAELKKGDKAPAFKMTGSDGKDYELKQFKGKKTVVVAWYPKAFTGG